MPSGGRMRYERERAAGVVSAGEMIVIADPTHNFTPGAVYNEGDIAAWLRDDELPEGLQVEYRHKVYAVRGQRLEHEDSHWSVWRKPYTPTRWRVLSEIVRVVDRDGRPPTHRELAALIGVRCGAISYHIQSLAREGYLFHDRGAWRGAWPTEAGVIAATTIPADGIIAGESTGR